MVRFIISRTRHKKFFFTVESLEEQTLLTSQLYSSKGSCKKGITSLKNTVRGVGRYQWVEENNNTVSFIIKSVNGQKLANSEMYNCFPETTEILSMLKAEIPKALIIDQTIKLKKLKNSSFANQPLVTMIIL